MHARAHGERGGAGREGERVTEKQRERTGERETATQGDRERGRDRHKKKTEARK